MGGGSKTVVPFHFWARIQRPGATGRERSARKVKAVLHLPSVGRIMLDLRRRASNHATPGGRTPTIVFLGDEEAEPAAPSGP